MNKELIKSLKYLFFIWLGFSIIITLSNYQYISFKNVLYTLSISALYTFGFGAGNMIYGKYISTKYNWIDDTKKIILISIIVLVIYDFIIAFGIQYLFVVVKNKKDLIDVFVGRNLWQIFYTIIIAIGISMFFYAKSFMQIWKQSVKKEQELEKNFIAAKYEALKNQTDPHFFFNSLNVLSSLIEENKESAQKYIDELSLLYRYILQNKNNELVSLKEELNFADKYIYLNKIKYEEGILINKEISEISNSKKIAPLSLQIILENIFKHNAIVEDNPITIILSSTSDYLLIKNNIVEKKIMPSSNKIGIKNLKERYLYLTDKKIEINHTKEYFEVKIPLI